MNWAPAPGYDGQVIDYFEGPFLDLSGNYYGSQWLTPDGLFLNLDNNYPGGGMARSLITNTSHDPLSEQLWNETRRAFCGNATLYPFVPQVGVVGGQGIQVKVVKT